MTQNSIGSIRSNKTLESTELDTTINVTEDGHEVKCTDTIQTVDKTQWNGVVESSDCGTVFHRYEWIDAIETGLGYPAKHVIVTKDGNTIGVFPNFVVDLPKVPLRRLQSVYPGFGGPAITTDVAESLSLMSEAIRDLCTGRTIVHEIRACNSDYVRYSDHFRAQGYRPARIKGRFLLHLDKGYDAILSGMSKSRRKGIRQGRKTDHEIVNEEITMANLERFYRAYERHMNQVGGEVYPMAFFEELLDMKSRLLLLTLRIDGEYAGGFLELLNDEQSSVHGFFASIPKEYYEYNASEILYDRVIRWAIENGYETYDFGGADGDFESGVFRFKEGFGGQLVPNLYWERGTGLSWNLVKAGRSIYLRNNDSK
ncbi:lipid II:glycine glycyltransferase FemX [Natronorubrum sp. FCH18a]|uniref:lipid II:glycine glycyltransferase FemX n=1 Tax=Natronorubrum sp. FCH18a TaxID=3447018 RepID=UPI003F510EED